MHAQGVSLVLSSCQALGHRPEAASLACLEAAMRAGLPRYKRGELAACLEAFKAWGYCPSSDLLQACAALLACDFLLIPPRSGVCACMHWTKLAES
jgi:hypothetical protein